MTFESRHAARGRSEAAARGFLRPIVAVICPVPWLLALALCAGIVIWRALLMLGPSRGAGPVMALHFVVLALLPMLMLSRDGRRQIGLTRARSAAWYVLGPLLGAVAAMVFWYVGVALFEETADHWFVTVRQALFADPRLRAMTPAASFVTLALPAAIFSPIGEELFFRGYLHESLARRMPEAAAAATTSAVFGAMHVLHHGVSVGMSGLEWRALSGAIWVVLAALLSLLFIRCRRQSASIWPAVLAHAAFNVMMVAVVVAWLASSP